MVQNKLGNTNKNIWFCELYRDNPYRVGTGQVIDVFGNTSVRNDFFFELVCIPEFVKLRYLV